MKDRFKFRVWFDGRFIYKSLCDSNVYTEDNKCICLANTLPVDLPWEQCTGLKDKNGKLIYDGDILKTNSGNIYYIKWDEKTGSFREEDYNCQNVIYRAGHHLCLWKDSYCESYEIVGNIHENPELLEKE